MGVAMPRPRASQTRPLRGRSEVVVRGSPPSPGRAGRQVFRFARTPRLPGVAPQRMYGIKFEAAENANFKLHEIMMIVSRCANFGQTNAIQRIVCELSRETEQV